MISSGEAEGYYLIESLAARFKVNVRTEFTYDIRDRKWYAVISTKTNLLDETSVSVRCDRAWLFSVQEILDLLSAFDILVKRIEEAQPNVQSI